MGNKRVKFTVDEKYLKDDFKTFILENNPSSKN